MTILSSRLLVSLVVLSSACLRPLAAQSPNTAAMIVVVQDPSGALVRDARISVRNPAFRQAKGTGDLFVNQIYFATGAGSRRTTPTTLDGATNDESWGRQIMVANLPIGAVQEITVLSNAFSSEFGWTAGPALN